MKKKDRKLITWLALGIGAYWLLNRNQQPAPPVKATTPRSLPATTTAATRREMRPADAVGSPYRSATV